MNDFFKKIISEGPKPEYINQLETFVKDNGKPWSNSQLRSLFEILQNIEDDKEHSKSLVKFGWKFAYMIGKETDKYKRKAYNDLYKSVVPAIKTAKKPEHIKNLKDLFEAIIAYHRYYCVYGDRG